MNELKSTSYLNLVRSPPLNYPIGKLIRFGLPRTGVCASWVGVLSSEYYWIVWREMRGWGRRIEETENSYLIFSLDVLWEGRGQ